MTTETIPLSLYIHIPWCIQKCPYCDFNSHAATGELPEKTYVNQLLLDLETQLNHVQNRSIHSIFIGGGTPSLFSPNSYVTLFDGLKKKLCFVDNIEITLEANPGAIDTDHFDGFLKAGINRLSIGVQSFQDHQLKKLGRIHQANDANNAVISAQKAGFKNINVDLMFGLPDQTIKDALFDLETAMTLSPQHLSWYQLTLEPNTFFYRFPPALPSDDLKFDIQMAGQALLADREFQQYEVSAYAKNNAHCKHNVNYWQFGDYLGIGAGAHAKFTHLNTMQITRRCNTKHPKAYLSANKHNLFETNVISQEELPLEFMMNALRLNATTSVNLFESRTGLHFSEIQKPLEKARDMGFLNFDAQEIKLTNQGRLFLNDVLALF